MSHHISSLLPPLIIPTTTSPISISISSSIFTYLLALVYTNNSLPLSLSLYYTIICARAGKNMSTGNKTSEVDAAASSSSAAPREQAHGNGSVSGGGASSASSLLRSASLSISHRHHNNNNAPKAEESDEEDLFMVPDIEEDEENEQESTDSPKNTDLQLMTNGTSAADAAAKRRRGRNPVDRECRRLKRLLRNRVSAQQARERKKVYVNDMESRAKDLMELNSKLEEKISTLVNENTMLRKVLMNTRPKADETIEPTKDLLR
ncbi:hypothetical protein LguiB_025438 [Lonicera macranthoides]